MLCSCVGMVSNQVSSLFNSQVLNACLLSHNKEMELLFNASILVGEIQTCLVHHLKTAYNRVSFNSTCDPIPIFIHIKCCF